MDKFAHWSATELLAAMQARLISSVELLELYIDRYEKVNPAINAIVTTDFDRARERARAADDARAKGRSWGSLHGLPMTIKECIEVAGTACTSGFRGLRDHVSTRNAAVTDALLAAGAIIFGKTNAPLLTMDMQSYNEIYGQTNNPWDPTRVPGGSSGGSAAALAAGLTALEVGSDIGGSIRNPAHFCGVYGHKPTFGVVSMRGHVPPMPGIFPGEYSYDGDLQVIGPLARSAEDLQLVMDIIAGPKAPERVAYRLEFPAPRREALNEFRIGLWLDDAAFPVDSNVGAPIQALVDALAAAGAKVSDRRPDIDFTHSHDVYTRLLYAHQSEGLPDHLFARAESRLPQLDIDDKSYRAQWVRGTAISHHDWRRLNHERLLMRQKWADFFKDHDVLLCPVVGVTAFPHDHRDIFERTLRVNGEMRSYLDTLLPWAGLATVSYLPSTVVPVGLAKDGLPVGVQVVGPYLEDRTTIHFARLIKELTGGLQVPREG